MGSSKIVNGDSADELKKLEDNSVDLLCTDPPYGYSFMGKSWDNTLPPREIFEESLRVLKPGSFAFVMSAPRSDVQYRMAQMLDEVGFEVGYTPIYWTYATGFPKAMNVGKKTKKENLDGSYGGYQPKPAVEVVIVAMKPLDQKGYLDQALHNGKGVTWLDSCRIPFSGTSDEEQFDKDNVAGQMNFDEKYEKGEGKMYEGGWEKPKRKTTKRKPREENTVFKTSGFKSEDNDTAEASPLGRFAANLLVSDDVMNDGVLRKAGKYKGEGSKSGGIWRESTGEPAGREYGDEGSFSRYYSLDAWWEDRVQKLPDEVKRTFPFLIVPKPSKSEKNMGLDKFNKQQKIFNGQSDKSSKDMKGVEKKFTTQPSSNIHPTVKPTTLMSYLVTLGSRKGDVVLDPFAGSGTTGISCVFSERNYLLIEREKEYFDILKARIKKAENPAGIVQHEWF